MSTRERPVAQSPSGLAEELFGSASAELLAEPKYAAILGGRISDGMSLEDAVFAIVFDYGLDRAPVAEEFFQVLHRDLSARSQRWLSEGLQRAASSTDLVQSVLKDFWGREGEFEFRGRKQFLAYLEKGIVWKASANRARAGQSRRVSAGSDLEGLEGLIQEHDESSPLSVLITEEQREELHRRLHELSEEDEVLIRHFLQGRSYPEIAVLRGKSPSAVKSALRRAIERLRKGGH